MILTDVTMVEINHTMIIFRLSDYNQRNDGNNNKKKHHLETGANFAFAFANDGSSLFSAPPVNVPVGSKISPSYVTTRFIIPLAKAIFLAIFILGQTIVSPNTYFIAFFNSPSNETKLIA
ncbi:hypothetical protein DERP_013866 [Dermatophagoides pteronyssinus]|uniref:Uncharacterized protein n=1 Tax=Dermatophagoides pteronyssinus TaxID=6956 RepID=A0ABQ8J3E8_DERPT|nr:hypothetical protein DERP_013866 [Dermatophagoides pteronyssinus]